MTNLKLILIENGYELWIITTYRYFPEWAYSVYTQMNKCKPRNGSFERNYDHWPDEGGWEVPTFEAFINRSEEITDYNTYRMIDFHTLGNVTIYAIDIHQGDIMK